MILGVPISKRRNCCDYYFNHIKNTLRIESITSVYSSTTNTGIIFMGCTSSTEVRFSAAAAAWISHGNIRLTQSIDVGCMKLKIFALYTLHLFVSSSTPFVFSHHAAPFAKNNIKSSPGFHRPIFGKGNEKEAPGRSLSWATSSSTRDLHATGRCFSE